MNKRPVIDLGLGHVRIAPPEAQVVPGLGAEYGPAEGFPLLREKIADWEKLSPEEVIITVGASLGLVASLAILPKGSSVLCPRPYYPAYPKVIGMLGLNVVYYDLDSQTGWQLDLDQMKSLLRKDISALILNFPGNPVGNLPAPELLAELRNMALRASLTIISDEVYTDFIYEDFRSPDMRTLFAPGPVIRLRSFSKLFGIPGERLGYVIADPACLKAISRAHWSLAMSPPATTQAIALKILQTSPEQRAMHLRETLSDIRRRVAKILMTNNRIRFHVPLAGVFFWIEIPDCHVGSEQLAQECLEKAGVVVIPGAAFGIQHPVYLRASFAIAKEKAVTGFKSLVKFLNQL